jgi:hypothetical protein
MGEPYGHPISYNEGTPVVYTRKDALRAYVSSLPNDQCPLVLELLELLERRGVVCPVSTPSLTTLAIPMDDPYPAGLSSTNFLSLSG